MVTVRHADHASHNVKHRSLGQDIDQISSLTDRFARVRHVPPFHGPQSISCPHTLFTTLIPHPQTGNVPLLPLELPKVPHPPRLHLPLPSRQSPRGLHQNLQAFNTTRQRTSYGLSAMRLRSRTPLPHPVLPTSKRYTPSAMQTRKSRPATCSDDLAPTTTSARPLLAETDREATRYRGDADEVRNGKNGHFRRHAEGEFSGLTASTQRWRVD